jgi:hypothetical protein
MKIPQTCTQKFSCRSNGGKLNGEKCGIGYLIGFLTVVLKLNTGKTADHSACCRFEGSYFVILICISIELVTKMKVCPKQHALFQYLYIT